MARERRVRLYCEHSDEHGVWDAVAWLDVDEYGGSGASPAEAFARLAELLATELLDCKLKLQAHGL